MTSQTTLMAYSMSKTITAAATLQLVEQGKIALDDSIDTYLDGSPYGRAVTVRNLLSHTSGIPNPIPLRWVHLFEKHASFDEQRALQKVLEDHPKLQFQPGTRFLYSNIGYWLLGRIVARASAQPFESYIGDHVLSPLRMASHEMSYAIPDLGNHAKGYLEKYSVVNLFKGFVTDRELWGGYEGEWLNLKPHYVNGPAFGGLVGTARGFAKFLQDQLHEDSALFSPATRHLFYKQQALLSGKPIKMTLGWHTDEMNEKEYFYKEGGGGGFHCEIRLYPGAGIASVMFVNATSFNVRRALSVLDEKFVLAPGR